MVGIIFHWWLWSVWISDNFSFDQYVNLYHCCKFPNIMNFVEEFIQLTNCVKPIDLVFIVVVFPELTIHSLGRSCSIYNVVHLPTSWCCLRGSIEKPNWIFREQVLPNQVSEQWRYNFHSFWFKKQQPNQKNTKCFVWCNQEFYEIVQSQSILLSTSSFSFAPERGKTGEPNY